MIQINSKHDGFNFHKPDVETTNNKVASEKMTSHRISDVLQKQVCDRLKTAWVSGWHAQFLNMSHSSFSMGVFPMVLWKNSSSIRSEFTKRRDGRRRSSFPNLNKHKHRMTSTSSLKKLVFILKSPLNWRHTQSKSSLFQSKVYNYAVKTYSVFAFLIYSFIL